MRILHLYPGAWRARYGEEMAALLETRPVSWRDRLDLLRGALDAWIHPPTPSRTPAVASLLGGGLWTVVAAGVLFGPTPPDWPGYFLEVVPVAVVAVAVLSVAVLGCALRSGDAGAGPFRLTAAIAVTGYASWVLVLVATAAGWVDQPSLAAAQTLAIVGTTLIGSALVMSGDATIGGLITASGMAMLVPWSTGWLVFGAAWTAIGIVLWLERTATTDPTRLAS